MAGADLEVSPHKLDLEFEIQNTLLVLIFA